MKPSFSLPDAHFSAHATMLAIRDGSLGYTSPVLTSINLSMQGKDRVYLTGHNASGKSTLLKAIIGSSNVCQLGGSWTLPPSEEVGYLDQHYNHLNSEVSVLANMEQCVPAWSAVDIRKHLADFLFRRNEEVDTCVQNLSGGEKARLSLACIAAKTPKFLILDELTNNLDLPTKNHIINVLQNYPGALLVVDHDEAFAKQLGLRDVYSVANGRCCIDIAKA